MLGSWGLFVCINIKGKSQNISSTLQYSCIPSYAIKFMASGREKEADYFPE